MDCPFLRFPPLLPFVGCGLTSPSLPSQFHMLIVLPILESLFPSIVFVPRNPLGGGTFLSPLTSRFCAKIISIIFLSISPSWPKLINLLMLTQKHFSSVFRPSEPDQKLTIRILDFQFPDLLSSLFFKYHDWFANIIIDLNTLFSNVTHNLNPWFSVPRPTLPEHKGPATWPLARRIVPQQHHHHPHQVLTSHKVEDWSIGVGLYQNIKYLLCVASSIKSLQSLSRTCQVFKSDLSRGGGGFSSSKIICSVWPNSRSCVKYNCQSGGGIVSDRSQVNGDQGDHK